KEEGRRKKEEGRGKGERNKEEGRLKRGKEEGRGKKEPPLLVSIMLGARGVTTVNCQLSTKLDIQVVKVEFGAVGFDELAAGCDSIAH
ncbi:MAG: hypothetical protein HC849_13645, partial [Oscillatoriales cyanobacterium RU_3_3]|nr:hypothetical protein [Oscillatoriales cyanobacterium RU_3_3]